MSKTYQESLQDFTQALMESERYVTSFALPIFKAELDLFNESWLNNFLFEFYKKPFVLTEMEQKNTYTIVAEAVLAKDIASVKLAKALGASLFENTTVAAFLPSLASQEHTTELMDILLEAGYSPTINSGSVDLIHCATWEGRIETVKLLFEKYNARPEGMDIAYSGRIPSCLVVAAQQVITNKNLSEEIREGCRKIVQFFLSKGISDFDKGQNTTISQEDFDALITAERALLDFAEPRSSAQAKGEEIDTSEDYQASGAAGDSGVKLVGASALSSESDTE